MDKKVTCRAKVIAERLGISLDRLNGTGNNGEITVNDVKRAVLFGTNAAKASAYDSTKPDEIKKMTSMQRTICRSMQESLEGTAQATNKFEADITELVELYKKLKPKYAAAGIKLSYTALFIKALAMALENHPMVRVQYVDEETLRIPKDISIGCAVDIPDGLVVPVIRNANLKDLRTICLELFDLTNKAKNNGLTMDDFGNASMSITNLGMFGATYSTPVLNSPEAMILGSGSIMQVLRMKNGIMTPVQIVNFSLTTDHRIIKDSDAALFMADFIGGLKEFKWI